MIWPARRASKFLQLVENILILTYRAGSSQLPADVTLKRFQIPSLHQRINGIGQCRAPGFDIFLIISIRDSEEPSIIYLTLLTKSKLIIFWRFEYFVNVKYYREFFFIDYKEAPENYPQISFLFIILLPIFLPVNQVYTYLIRCALGCFPIFNVFIDWRSS